MRISIPFLCSAVCLTGIAAGAGNDKPTHQQIDQNTRLQIFLDNANFGPGKIDGRQGEFTRKAVALFNQSKGQTNSVPQNPEALIDTTGMDLSSVEPVFICYSVTEEDFANVGELPSGPASQSKVKRLPYASVAEAIAEKFHSDLGFLKELNPKKLEKLKAGDQVTVPNVKPFELSGVKNLEPGSEAAAIVANELGEDPSTAPAASAGDDASVSIRVSVKDEMLEVHAGDKVVAAFPVTVGSQQTVSPVGKWKIAAIAKMPNFRYDPKMLKEGERSANFHMLPPGPNNPVGVVWIALNKKGIGMHGTNDPDSIGRSASHGCIRLANWDIVKLAEIVKRGTSVAVE